MNTFIKGIFFLSTIFTLFTGSYVASEESVKVTIISQEGTVEIFDTQTNKWASVRAPYEITQGDRIKTSKNSFCILEFDGSEAKIGELSEVAVKAVTELISLNLAYGEVINKLKTLPKGSSFVVETPEAIAGSRGTIYRVYVIKEKSLTKVSVLEKEVFLESRKEPSKNVVIYQMEERDICPWDKTVIQADGFGELSENLIDESILDRSSKERKLLSPEEYSGIFGARARLTTKRAAIADAYRNLAGKIYGVVIDSKKSLENIAEDNKKVALTVEGIVRGAHEINADYYSDGSVEVLMEIKGLVVKNELIPVTGDIFGIDCISGPEIIEEEDLDKILF